VDVVNLMKKRRKKKVDRLTLQRRKFAKKLVATILIIIFFLLIGRGIIYVLEKISLVEEETEGLEAGLPSLFMFEETDFVKANCSDENLIKIWDAIFIESSDEITIKSDRDASKICNYSLMYKNLSGNMNYIVFLEYIDEDYKVKSVSQAFYGNFTNTFLDAQENADPAQLKDFTDNYIGSENIFNYINDSRSIASTTEANTEFHNIFQVENGTWGEGPDPINPSFSFGDHNEQNSSFGEIHKDIVLDHFYRSEIISDEINLTQIQNITNLTLYGADTKIIDLNDYFVNVWKVTTNTSLSYYVTGSGIFSEVKLEENLLSLTTNEIIGGKYLMNITLSHVDWTDGDVTSDTFNLTVIGCVESDGGQYDFTTKGSVENQIFSATDSCDPDNNKYVIEYWCETVGAIENTSYYCTGDYVCEDGACTGGDDGEGGDDDDDNEAPVFLDDKCGQFYLIKNTPRTIDLDDCFNDTDDELEYRYENKSSGNVTIEIDDDDLEIYPDTGWIGIGDFYVYANDSIDETRGEINFRVQEPSSSNTTDTISTTTTTGPKIVDSYPVNGDVELEPDETLEFSVDVDDYDSIRWYIDGDLVDGGETFYEVDGLSEGEYEVKVEIKKGSATTTKTWKLSVGKSKEAPIKKTTIYFIIILVIISILILFVVLLIIKTIMDKKEGYRTKLGVKQDPKKAWAGAVQPRYRFSNRRFFNR